MYYIYKIERMTDKEEVLPIEGSVPNISSTNEEIEIKVGWLTVCYLQVLFINNSSTFCFTESVYVRHWIRQFFTKKKKIMT